MSWKVASVQQEWMMNVCERLTRGRHTAQIHLCVCCIYGNQVVKCLSLQETKSHKP